jgi:hypothetical protein
MIWLSLAILILMFALLASEKKKMYDNLNEAYMVGYKHGRRYAEHHLTKDECMRSDMSHDEEKQLYQSLIDYQRNKKD